MAELTIKCPRCKNEIKLTESLAAPLVESTRADYERRLAEKDDAVATAQRSLREREANLSKAKESLDSLIAEKVREERSRIVAEEAGKAKRLLATDIDKRDKEIKELQTVLDDRNKKLEEAQKVQTEFSRKQRELDDAKRELDLTVEKRIQEQLATLRDKAKREAEEELGVKVTEKEQTISSMKKEIENLRRKAEQGSQQSQGEALELALEDMLRSAFPHDTIEPVPKGVTGGDAIHKIINTNGQHCGTILWETKRTKNWSNSWVLKLKDNKVEAKADLAVLMTVAMPENHSNLTHIDGVWITNIACMIGLATALRSGLVNIAVARTALAGKQEKMDILYNYLTGIEFRQQIEAVVETFASLQSDLASERRAMEKIWKKRQKQLDRVIKNTVGMYGELEAIIGGSLPKIESLELKQLTFSGTTSDANGEEEPDDEDE